MSAKLLFSTENRLLAGLLLPERERLTRSLERVHLPKGKTLYEVGDAGGYAYFPLSGLITLSSVTEDGVSVVAAMTGNEGMIGVPLVLGGDWMPYRAMVQIPGAAMRMRASMARAEFSRAGRFHDLVLQQTLAVFKEISQSIICNRVHTIEQRLCRWLLSASDKMNSDELGLTHDSLSDILRAQRPRITAAARSLRERGAIKYSHGKITIVDRQELQGLSCRCYEVAKRELKCILAS